MFRRTAFDVRRRSAEVSLSVAIDKPRSPRSPVKHVSFRCGGVWGIAGGPGLDSSSSQARLSQNRTRRFVAPDIARALGMQVVHTYRSVYVQYSMRCSIMSTRCRKYCNSSLTAVLGREDLDPRLESVGSFDLKSLTKMKNSENGSSLAIDLRPYL